MEKYNNKEKCDIFIKCNKKYTKEENSNSLNLIKLWNSLKSSSIKSRKEVKIESSYNYDDNLEQHSDNESDKTKNEYTFKYNNSITRSKNSIFCNNYEKSIIRNKTSYNKRDKSLDIVRNKEEKYEIVLPYQRYSKIFK
tara:strand:+ start:10289 stop:10705 length:417 start_codon:yes stop_codon:yes gene_type:complete